MALPRTTFELPTNRFGLTYPSTGCIIESVDPVIRTLSLNYEQNLYPEQIGTQAYNNVGLCAGICMMHQQIEPPILYLGTPVVLVSTLNPDGTPNISPMSSAWWLGWSCMLGLDASSQTTLNLLRTGECVLNLPSVNEVAHVDLLARKTASDPMPAHKIAMGWDIERNKFGRAELTPLPSLDVKPPRAAECPVQLEAVLVNNYAFAEADPRIGIAMRAIEVRITKVHADPAILSLTHENRFDPDAWNPLLMSFLKFYGRGDEAHPSYLAELPQEAWAGREPKQKRETAP